MTHPLPTPAQSGATNARRNLVLGLAWRLPLEDLSLFAKSLRKAAPGADVVLFTRDTSPDTQQLAMTERIELLPLASCYYALRSTKGARQRNDNLKRIRNYLGIKFFNGLMRTAYPLARIGYTHEECGDLRREISKLIVNTQSARFVMFLDFLKNRSTHYDKVMLTDVRDVFFQSDPFAQVPDGELCMYEEEGPLTIGTEPQNRRWVQACFGQKILRQIAHHRVICSGVTIGSVANICGYLEAMEPPLLQRSLVYITDQAIHNFLARTGRLNHLNPKIIKNGDGIVLTAGVMNESQFQWDSSGRLVNAAGVPYAVIHQFDRHASLISRLPQQVC